MLKLVNVDRIVERNIETIKQVHAGPERIVPIHVEKIKEVQFQLRVLACAACLHEQLR